MKPIFIAILVAMAGGAAYVGIGLLKIEINRSVKEATRPKTIVLETNEGWRIVGIWAKWDHTYKEAARSNIDSVYSTCFAVPDSVPGLPGESPTNPARTKTQIQAAIDRVSKAGGNVWVAGGTYRAKP